MTKPANPFEWRRYVVEEAQRCEKNLDAKDAGTTSRKRSIAATRAIERARETMPAYGTVGMSKKTQAMIDLKPREFNVYSKAQSKK